MLGQNDEAALAVIPIINTHVTTLVLVRVTLLGAGLPVVSAGVATFPPAIIIWTVANDLTLSIGGIGWTVLGTLVITRL